MLLIQVRGFCDYDVIAICERNREAFSRRKRSETFQRLFICKCNLVSVNIFDCPNVIVTLRIYQF